MKRFRNPLQDLNRRIIECERCPRLVRYRQEVSGKKPRPLREWTYWSKPVPGFGDPEARVVVIGLAPAAHGGNRTGRMFTGDGSARTLIDVLYQVGWANQPTSEHRDDGLRLSGCYLTAICRCAPPRNKPLRSEMVNCRDYLVEELLLLRKARVLVTLGQMAFDGTLSALKVLAQRMGEPWTPGISRLKFGHGRHYRVPDPRGGPYLDILASYHPSRQNTNTGRLTMGMLKDVLRKAKDLADEALAAV